MVIVDDGIVAGKATGRLTDLLSTMRLTKFVTKCQDIYVAQVSNTPCTRFMKSAIRLHIFRRFSLKEALTS
jgi:hypothetical protein